jgi:Raf kinase inhibitor-like YbhB/YbcL family protein
MKLDGKAGVDGAVEYHVMSTARHRGILSYHLSIPRLTERLVQRQSKCARVQGVVQAVAVMGLSLAGVALAADQPFRLTSPDLPPGKPIAERHTANAFGCHGPNESPILKWEGAPAGTRSFAVTMFDPYKPPASGWWHWIVYDLPPTTTMLPRKAGDPRSPDMPSAAKQGLPDGDAPERHYYGPCPDVGDPAHHYVITVYALSVDHLDVPATATSAQIDSVIASKTLAKASIERPFARPAPVKN